MTLLEVLPSEVKNLDIISEKCLNCDLKIYKHILNEKCNEIINMSATVNCCGCGCGY